MSHFTKVFIYYLLQSIRPQPGSPHLFVWISSIFGAPREQSDILYSINHNFPPNHYYTSHYSASTCADNRHTKYTLQPARLINIHYFTIQFAILTQNSLFISALITRRYQHIRTMNTSNRQISSSCKDCFSTIKLNETKSFMEYPSCILSKQKVS